MFNPRYMFHATLHARIVQSQEELESLPYGWAESPQAASQLADPDVLAERVAAEASAEADRVAQVLAQAAHLEVPHVHEERQDGPAAEAPAVLTDDERIRLEVEADIQRALDAQSASKGEQQAAAPTKSSAR